MNMRQLTVFEMIAREGNMTKAAQKLYMSQPAVSHMIHDLEVELGIQLFDRIGKKIFLNEYGKLFLEKTRKVLEGYEDLCHGRLSPPLRIGSSITIADFWLPKILKEAKDASIDFIVDVDRSEAVYEKLTRNELDLALLEGEIFDERLIQIPFSEYELHAVCGKDHPYATKKSITLHQLCEEPLYLREKGSAIREVFDSALNLANLSVRPIYTSVNSQAIIYSIASGLGMSILPDLLLKDRNDLHILDIEGVTLKNRNRLVYPKDKYLSDSMKMLCAMIIKES